MLSTSWMVALDVVLTSSRVSRCLCLVWSSVSDVTDSASTDITVLESRTTPMSTKGLGRCRNHGA